jgi:hypothetical protein
MSLDLRRWLAARAPPRPSGANAVAEGNQAASSVGTRKLRPPSRVFASSRHRCRALQVNNARSIQEHFGVRHEELRNLE